MHAGRGNDGPRLIRGDIHDAIHRMLSLQALYPMLDKSENLGPMLCLEITFQAEARGGHIVCDAMTRGTGHRCRPRRYCTPLPAPSQIDGMAARANSKGGR
ncbi:hypothetical protein THI4931_09150 [Pandoraea sputorum]|nr:hypothetical protein THI4931_09150 [Pandoraea sputorum]